VSSGLSGAIYLYVSPPSVGCVSPSSGPSGSVFGVSGLGFVGAGAWFRFGDSSASSTGEVVSSSLALVEAPSSAVGELPVSVGVVGPESSFVVGGVSFGLVGSVVVRGVRPSRGALSGGSLVRVVYEGGWRGASGWSCAFGSVSPVAARASSSSSFSSPSSSSGGSRQCASPSHSSGRVPVEVGAGVGVGAVAGAGAYSASGVSFEYGEAGVAESVLPSVGLSSGGGVVSVVGTSLGEGACSFGGVAVRGVPVVFDGFGGVGGFVGAGGFVGGAGTSALSCVSPSSSGGGFVVVGALSSVSSALSVSSGLSGAIYLYVSPPSVGCVSPSSGPSGSVFGVSGLGFVGAGAWFRFGDSSASSTGEVVSSSLALVEAPSSAVGELPVSVGVVGPEASFVGGGGSFRNVGVFVAVSLSPGRVYDEHGQIILLEFLLLESEMILGLPLLCNVGPISVASSQVSSGAARFVAPSRAYGRSAVCIALNRADCSDGGLSLEYVAAGEIMGVFPEIGSALSIYAVDIMGHGLAPDLACLVGSEPSPALDALTPFGSMKCRVWEQALGFISVSLSNGHHALPSAAVFLLIPQAFVTSISPSLIFGQIGAVHASAHNVASQGSRCAFQGRVSAAHVVSSALAVCVLEDSFDASTAPLSLVVSPHAVQISTGEGGVDVTTTEEPSVSGAEPTTGPAAGGTQLTVFGNHFSTDASWSLKVGTVGPLSATRLAPTALEAVVPAHGIRDVDIRCVLDARDAAGGKVTYQFQAPPVLLAPVPSIAVETGGAAVFALGANFVNSTSLRCRFGDNLVRALFLSSTALMCMTPPQERGIVFFEISNNAIDFTATRSIFHITPCPPGRYCPDGDIIESPPGTFCAGDGNLNFTVCPPGTYQQQAGATVCLPSPIGYIAPDFGMALPRPCPRGSVCDITGLAVSDRLCPPGHYCSEGTRTFNFTDFTEPLRPLPCPFGYYCGAGVATKVPIMNNFSTPQPCFAGYLCGPGSSTPQGSGPCPHGHYCPPGQVIPCPPRTQCPGVGNIEPKPCEPGLYNQEFGQAQCKLCPRGTICPGFARLLPEKCPAGAVCDVEGLPIPNKRCPAGHFCLTNTVTRDPLAQLDEAALRRASPIELKDFNFRPRPCLPATYCMDGVDTNVTNKGVITAPQPCKEGSLCEWGTGDKTTAPDRSTLGPDDVYSNPITPCPPGTFCPEGTYIPIPAPRGSFARGTGNAAAVLCLPGLYTHYEGFSSCLLCPSGYECVNDGTFIPEICSEGEYRAQIDSVTCRKCPLGTWNPFKGMTASVYCIPCNPGTVCGVEGMSNNKPFGDNRAQVVNDGFVVELQPLGQATLCPEGYVCDAGTSVASVKCPDRYYCGYGTTPETQFNNPCPEGYYCPEGTSASGRFQFACLPCFYCPLGTGLILPRCPEGTMSQSQSRGLLDCLADGITFWRVQPLRDELIAYTRMNITAYLDAPDAGVDNDASAVPDLAGDLPDGEALTLGAAAGRRSLLSNETGDYDTSLDHGVCLGQNFHLLEPEVVMRPTGEPSQDEMGTNLTWFKLPRYYIAKLSFDFRNLTDELVYGEHFGIYIFVGERSNKVDCQQDEMKEVPCKPYIPDPNGLVIGRDDEERRFEEKCPASTDAEELPFWMEHQVAGEFVTKRGMVELNIMSNGDVDVENTAFIKFRVEVRMLHGQFQHYRTQLANTLCIDVLRPERVSPLADHAFQVIMPRVDGLMLPLNAPQREPLHRDVWRQYFTCNEALGAVGLSAGCRRKDPSVTMAFNVTRTALSVNYQYVSDDENVLNLRRLAGAANTLGDEAPLAPASVLVPTTGLLAARRAILEGGLIEPAQKLGWSARRQMLQTGGAPVPVPSTADYAVLNTVPDLREEEENVLQDPSLYWAGTGDILALKYLPYFSNCRGTDSNIVLYQLLETSPGCELVNNETIFIDQWAPQNFNPVADVCDAELTCFFEENFKEQAAVLRWFEVEEETIFYLTPDGTSPDEAFRADILASETTTPQLSPAKLQNMIATQQLIPVDFVALEVGEGIVPTEVTIILEYFQMEDAKRLITAVVEMGEYVSARKHDGGDYTLKVAFEPLNFFRLLNAFAFDFTFYVILFLGIGSFAVMIVLLFLVFNRIFTRLRDPPPFRFFPYLRIGASAPFVGVGLALVPFMVGCLAVQFFVQGMQLFSFVPQDIDNPTDDPALIEKRDNGRMAVGFLTLALYMVWITAKILVPKRLTEEEEEEEDSTWEPEAWKRSHFIVAVVAIQMINVALIEFSFTALYGDMFFTCFLIMKVFHIVVDKYVENFLKEVLLCTPVSISLALTAGLVTISADDFTDFTLGFFLELLIGLSEYVYLDAAMGAVTEQLPKVKRILDRLYYRVRKRAVTEDLLAGEVAEEDSVVEDLMGFLTAYGANTIVLLLTVPYIFFYFYFNAQLRLSFLFGIRQRDLLIYLIFAVVIVIFQVVCDIFTFNIQELFHGWNLYEYMKYARYRFLHRSARWKGLETQFDESIEEGMRSVDQMCFSSQFYFVLSLGGAGAFLITLAISMMLRAEYNMFADPCFLMVIGLMCAFCEAGQKVGLILADMGGLWKLADLGGDAGERLAVETELPYEFQQFVDAGKHAARVLERHEWDGDYDGPLTSARMTSDTFRREFLDKNRLWLLEEFGAMLTPRTAAKLKLGGKVYVRRGDESDSDLEDRGRFDHVDIEPACAALMRRWLAEARRHAPRRGRAALLISSSSEDEEGGGTFGHVSITPPSHAVLRAWLAASRVAAETMGGFGGVISSEDDATEAGASPFGNTILTVSRASHALVRVWLARARGEVLAAGAAHSPRKARSPRSYGPLGISSTDSDSELEGGGTADRPRHFGEVRLSQPSRTVLGVWVAASLQRAGGDAEQGRRLRDAVLAVSSDDSGSEAAAPRSLFGRPNMARGTIAILRTWLVAMRRMKT